MKKFLYLSFVMIIIGICFMYKDELIHLYYDIPKYFIQEDIQLTKNDYYRDYNFLYLSNTDDFEPHSEQDIVNIFYTVINSGLDSFTFYCPKDYTDCTSDVAELANDQTRLSHINNFVHPYNSFKHIETKFSSIGEVRITINRSYTNDDILAVNAKVDEIYNSLINPNASKIENIRVIHDYIINNSKYDSQRSDYNIINYKSDLAYGPLIQGYGICGGYSDAMQLFLEKLNIKNYRISSDSHVWNAVYLNNAWYHLDLTWDDPVTSNKTDILQDDFLLITTDDLLKKEVKEHNFNQDVYLELKQY